MAEKVELLCELKIGWKWIQACRLGVCRCAEWSGAERRSSGWYWKDCVGHLIHIIHLWLMVKSIKVDVLKLIQCSKVWMHPSQTIIPGRSFCRSHQSLLGSLWCSLKFFSPWQCPKYQLTDNKQRDAHVQQQYSNRLRQKKRKTKIAFN